MVNFDSLTTDCVILHLKMSFSIKWLRAIAFIIYLAKGQPNGTKFVK